MVVELEQGLVDEAFAEVRIVGVVDDGQVNGLAHVAVVHAHLVDHLVLPLPKHGGVAVGREHDEGHVLVEGLRDGRPVIAGRRGGGA